MGAKVLLFNAVLNNIPTYMLSFFKTPKSIVEEIVRIKRIFFLVMVMVRERFVGLVGIECVCLKMFGS